MVQKTASNDSFEFNANTLRLNATEWMFVFGLVLLALILIPFVWLRVEKTEFSSRYRIPYASSNDYWMFSRWAKEAVAAHPYVMVGDSVIWSHYTDMDAALPAQLSRGLAAKNTVANLGVDGLHPIAMYGLLRYHGRSIRNTAVVLHLNLLWMSSPEHDLQVVGSGRFNHPDLVPQVYPDIPAYQPSWPTIVDVAQVRYVSFMKWLSHFQYTYFENMDVFNWSLMYPSKNPFSVVDFKLPEPVNSPRSKPVSWTKHGIPADQDHRWVASENSLQWKFFKKTIRLLQNRGNEVFVLIGPFNTHLLSADNAIRYQGLLDEVVQAFAEEQRVAFHVSAVPPSLLFGDASHPLEEGYTYVVQELMASKSFQAWIHAID